jgi:hypothetical protein
MISRTAQPTKIAITPTSAYQRQTMAGFRVLIAPDLLADHAAKASAGIGLLSVKLNEVNRLLPAKATDTLRRGVGFWLEWARDEHGAQYHPSAEWLRQNGVNPDKEHCVEISNVQHFLDWCQSDQPMMIVHELAHAYHQQVLGFENAAVRAAYQSALTSRKYDAVPYIHGGLKRAYALTNEREYFAEITEAYFGKNDFFPYVRKDLAQFDPQGFALVESAWQVGNTGK